MHELIDLESDVAVRRPLDGLCSRIGGIVATAPPQHVAARVAELLPRFLARPDLLTEAQMRAPAAGYGREVVFLCPSETFSVLAVVWPPGISSPVHDHQTWCALGVYRGEVEETRFEPAGERDGRLQARAISSCLHRPGDAAYLPSDVPDIHRMRNTGRVPAVTIHVYGGNSVSLGPNIETVYDVRS